jgi:hypothetical protein
MTTSATVTRTRTLHPRLVAGSIAGLCATIGLIVGIGLGFGLADRARADVVPVSRITSLVSPAGNTGLVYTGIPYVRAGLADRSPAGNHGLVFTGIPYVSAGLADSSPAGNHGLVYTGIPYARMP